MSQVAYVAAPRLLARQVIEVSFLTWCLSFSVPMWLEQTADGVSINAALWWSCLSRGVLFIAFGFVAAGAFDDLDTMNVLDVLRTHTAVKPITQVLPGATLTLHAQQSTAAARACYG